MKTKNLFFVILVLGLIGTSCKKNDSTPSNSNNSNSIKHLYRVVNGFDYGVFGTSHNAALDYLGANPDLQTNTQEQNFDYLIPVVHYEK